MAKWRPIETAPDDGSGILLFIPGYPGDVQAVVWSARRAEWCLLGLESISLNLDDNTPTHWMPLPEPPEGN